MDGTLLGLAVGLIQISNRKNTDRIIEATQPRKLTELERIKERQAAWERRQPTYVQGLPNSIPWPSAELPEPPPQPSDDDDDEGSGNI